MSRIFMVVCLFFTLGLGGQLAVSGELGVEVIFSDDEIAIIGAWYKDHRHKHASGHKKSKGLPPGIAKNLARGKPLPPGIAKQHLPDGLRVLLPPPPRGYERVIVDGKVLLVEIATRVIHDILVDIVLN